MMRLDRQHVTAASRIMLPTYAVFFAVLGFNYLATPRPRLLATPSLAYADSVMPLAAWGAFFLACSTIMTVALITGYRSLYRYALRLCAVAMTIWAVALLVASFQTRASPGGWAYSAFVVAACVASERSLSRREAD